MKPPRLGERFLRSFVPPGLVGESIVGDAQEEYTSDVRNMGRIQAWIRYWIRTMSVMRAYRKKPQEENNPKEENRTEKVTAYRAMQGGFGTVLKRTFCRWINDGRIASRGLFRTIPFTVVCVVTLALGLGGTATLFTLLHAVVLDPLPYPDSHQLVQIKNRVPGVSSDEEWHTSSAQYVHFTDHATSFEDVALYRSFGANIQTPEGPQRATGWYVTATALPLLGAQAHLGRLISRDDDSPGTPRVAVLSNEFWRSQFGSDPDVVDRTVTVNEQAFQIVGVLESGFTMPGAPLGFQGDIWIPLQIDRDGYFINSHGLPMVARLSPGVSIEEAGIELALLNSQLPDRFPNAYSTSFLEGYGFRSIVNPLKEVIVGDVSRTLWILFGGVAVVLMIAAANVASLFIARAEGRRRELLVRRALGASQWALARYLLTESLILTAFGGALALLVAHWVLPALTLLAPGTFPRIEILRLDSATIIFVVSACLVVCIGIALQPLSLLGSINHCEGKESGRSVTIGRERQRVRTGLIVGQVALALALLAASGLLIESMRALNRIHAGHDPEGVITANVYLTPSRYETDVEIWIAYRQMLESIRALPGVSAAGFSSELPILGRFGCTIQGFEEDAVYDRIRDAGLTLCAGQTPTTPGYFEAMGIPLLSGRLFSDGDNDNPTQGSVVVSRSFADRFWPGEDPLGKGVMPSGRTAGAVYRVIGVVGDIPARSIAGETAIAIYYPIVHNPDETRQWSGWFPTNMSLIVKTEIVDQLSIIPAVRRAVQAIDPTAPMANTTSMAEIISSSTVRMRFASLLLGIAAVSALLLASVGLYGVVSYLVTLRTREIGIRIAIGAAPSTVGREVVQRSLLLVGVGIVAGLTITFVANRAIRGILYGIDAFDPLTLFRAILVLVVVAGLASWLPARRASRVDPVEVLRTE